MLLATRKSAAPLVLLLGLANGPATQSETPEFPAVQSGAASLLEEMKAGEGSLSIQFGFYNHADGDGDGNPFLDEELTVVEPVIIYDYDVSDDFGFTAQLSYDFVSSASIERLNQFPEQSGASRDNYFGLDLGFRHRLEGGDRLGYHIGASFEYDYTSLALGGNYAWQPSGADATLNVSLNTFYDLIQIIRFDGTEPGDDERLSATAQLDWYQILSPKTSGDFGALVTFQSGFLETPYNFVVLETPGGPINPDLDNNASGVQIAEELPDSRVRGALFGKLRTRTSPGRALELGGRLYGDSWGIYSVSLEPSFIQTLIPDELFLQLRYRFYFQTESKYFEDSFGPPPVTERYRTQDSDLGGFTTNAFGFGLRWQTGPASALDLGLDYAMRSDGLDFVYGSLGWTWAF